MSKAKREAVVSLWRPGTAKGRVIFRASTIRKCERWLARKEKTDPEGLIRGDYCIGGTPRAEREYERLVMKRKTKK